MVVYRKGQSLAWAASSRLQVAVAAGIFLVFAAGCKSTSFNSQTPTTAGAAATNGTGTGGGVGTTTTGAGGVGNPGVGSVGSNGSAANGQVGANGSSNNGGLLGSLFGNLGNIGATIGNLAAAVSAAGPAGAGGLGINNGSAVNGTVTVGGQTVSPCSAANTVPGTANPYMAGEPGGTTITYDLSGGGGPNATDDGNTDASVLVQPTQANCIVPGAILAFNVWGLITYDKSVAVVSANGNMKEIFPHQKGALFGKSNVQAPLCALMGIFLGPGDPAQNPAPNGADFSSQSARDYVQYSPQLGEVFFIGTGLTSGGTLHQVVVPQGATRFFLATWDTYQWNNNLGAVTAQLLLQQ